MDQRLRRAYCWLLALSITSVGSIAALVLVWWRLGGDTPRGDDPGAKEEAVRYWVERAEGVFDSFPDPQVGRVLLPGLEGRKVQEAEVRTNPLGMREKDYAMPKPKDAVRVVLLGDSMVWGWRVQAEDRLGAFLERSLLDRVKSPRDIEVLHIAVSSWNAINASVYLRRQLELMRPDLVVHVLVENDLDDDSGVRGFGAQASFSVQRREQSRLSMYHPQQVSGTVLKGFLHRGLDHESRKRGRAAAASISRTAQSVEEIGGRYLALFYWGDFTVCAHRLIGTHLDPRMTAYVDPSFDRPEVRIDESDWHWNRRGHQEMAKLVYGLITGRDLLPELGLPQWEDAAKAVEDYVEPGAIEAHRQESLEALLEGRPHPGPVIDITTWTQFQSIMVHGGIDRRGIVSSYAAVIMATSGYSRIEIQGKCLPRRELRGCKLRVLVDDQEVGELALEPGVPFQQIFDLPSEIATQKYVTVTLESSDFAYGGRELRENVVFLLKRLAIRP